MHEGSSLHSNPDFAHATAMPSAAPRAVNRALRRADGVMAWGRGDKPRQDDRFTPGSEGVPGRGTPRPPMSAVRVAVHPHPILLPVGFTARWSQPLAAMPTPPWLIAALRPFATLADSGAPPELSRLGSDEAVRTAVRKLLRHGGYKPSGRGKPASEYLLGAADEGTLGSINLAVDLCNAVSLHAGLPISVVDLALAQPPLHLGIAADDASYVFNATGQEIKLAGLLCLHDAAGPCANAVKDAQRTKTRAETTAVLCVVWGSRELAERTAATLEIYRALTEQSGATLGPVEFAAVD